MSLINGQLRGFQSGLGLLANVDPPAAAPPAAGSITTAMLAAPSASGNVTYGNGTNVAQIVRNDKGQVVSAVNVPITFPPAAGGGMGLGVGPTNLQTWAAAAPANILYDVTLWGDSSLTYNGGTGEIQANIAGTYLVTASTVITGHVGGTFTMKLNVVVGGLPFTFSTQQLFTNGLACTVSAPITLLVGDTVAVNIEVQGGAGNGAATNGTDIASSSINVVKMI